MIAFEPQRLTTNKKNKAWRTNQVDAIASRIDEFGNDWYRIWQNYKLKNNQIEQEEYREYCDTLGLQKGEGKKFVEPFNKTHTIIEVLKGEESKMPWSFGVVNLSSKATNEMLRSKDREYRDYLDNKVAMEIERQSSITNALIKQKTEGMPQEEVEQAVQQAQAEYQEKEAKLLDPQQIKDKYINYKSKKEKTVHKLLKALAVDQNLKWLKNETFEDALLAGVEAVEICVDPHTKIPYVRQINALNLFFHKSADTPFIQDSDYVGYKEELTVSDVLDKYGEDLNKKDIDRLKQYNSKVFGLDAKFHSKNGESPSHWDNIKKYEYTQQHPLSTTPSYGTTNVLSDGLYASDKAQHRYENYCVVYTVYWKSQRRLGKLTYLDEYGEETSTFVDEEFAIPERATKSNYKPHMFSTSKTKWEWENKDGEPRSLEWLWLPEVWKGVRINGDIYVKIEPYENAYQSMLNPYKTKLPIHGFIYGNRNAFSTCIMDRIKPWQKLYYIIMSKWLKLITQDKGVIQLLNILMMDKGVGYERALQIGMDHGVLPYNPLAHTQGTNVAYSTKPAERLDLSNSSQLTYYTQLLEFVEQQMKVSAGVSDQRLAQTGASTNVTDNQRDMAQSMNITNSIFAGHEMLWQEVLQTLCETATKTLDNESGFMKQILSTDEIALIDLDLISLEDEYAVKVGNNTRAHQTLQEAKGFLQALVQNDKINFSTLLDMLDTDNLVEFKEELRGIEAGIERREGEMQQQQQEHDKEMQAMQQEQIEADRQQRLKEIELKGEYDILGKQISSMAWDPDKDRDRDGLPDILEIEQFRNKAFTDKEKLELERHKIAQEDKRISQKEEEMGMKERANIEDKTNKLNLKQIEARNKEKLEHIKNKYKPKETIKKKK
jgi:hypothetical protein